MTTRPATERPALGCAQVMKDPKTIAKFNTTADAQVACSLLEGLGIPAVIYDEQTTGLGLALMYGGVRLVVPAAQADEAVEALEARPDVGS